MGNISVFLSKCQIVKLSDDFTNVFSIAMHFECQRQDKGIMLCSQSSTLFVTSRCSGNSLIIQGEKVELSIIFARSLWSKGYALKDLCLNVFLIRIIVYIIVGVKLRI